MKYTEFHRKIIKNGWVFVRATGSHYFYEKESDISPPIPFHGAKEMPEGLRLAITKKWDLNSPFKQSYGKNIYYNRKECGSLWRLF